MVNHYKDWNAWRIENLSIGENPEKLRREPNQFEKQNEELQRTIEDLHQKIQNMKEEKSEDRIKIGRFKEELRRAEEINSKVSILLKRIEEQAVEINNQGKTCKACSQLKNEIKELKKKQKLFKFKAGIQTYHNL